MIKCNLKYYVDDPKRVDKVKNIKSQIILCHTSNSIKEHLTKFESRYFGKYTKIPTFTIDNQGIVYKHFNPLYSSEYIDGIIDKKAIIICLENLGWLNYDQFKNIYINWCGEQYNGEPIKVEWRNKSYWAEYSSKQIDKLGELIKLLCDQYDIEKNFIGNNIVTDYAENFNGILNRSNYSKHYYDLSPAMDFDLLNEKISK